MTAENYKYCYIRRASVLCTVMFASLALSVFLGTRISVFEHRIILPVSPFENGSVIEAISGICFFDTLSIFLLSLSLSKTANILLSVFVFFSRGLVIGCAWKMIVTNSVSYVAAILLLAYCTVTLFFAIYNLFLNTAQDKSLLCRMASYLVATGSVAVIRILPLLLLI